MCIIYSNEFYLFLSRIYNLRNNQFILFSKFIGIKWAILANYNSTTNIIYVKAYKNSIKEKDLSKFKKIFRILYKRIYSLYPIQKKYFDI